MRGGQKPDSALTRETRVDYLQHGVRQEAAQAADEADGADRVQILPPPDLPATTALIETGALSLDELITHRVGAAQADQAYRTAFGDPACLKMVLDWS